MNVKVHMLAFGNGEIREVEVPGTDADWEDNEVFLEAVFVNGQNENQPKPFPSVSVGDVIEQNDGKLYRVASLGFERMTRDQFTQYKNLERVERLFPAGFEAGKECHHDRARTHRPFANRQPCSAGGSVRQLR